MGLFTLGNIQPIQQEGKIVAARMIVYAREDDYYITYIIPSAYQELAEWMKYREESGEIITDNSWVMSDLWDTRVKISKGLVTIPKKLTAIGVKRLMERTKAKNLILLEWKKMKMIGLNESTLYLDKQSMIFLLRIIRWLI